jgi:hypothetical protein
LGYGRLADDTLTILVEEHAMNGWTLPQFAQDLIEPPAEVAEHIKRLDSLSLAERTAIAPLFQDGRPNEIDEAQLNDVQRSALHRYRRIEDEFYRAAERRVDEHGARRTERTTTVPLWIQNQPGRTPLAKQLLADVDWLVTRNRGGCWKSDQAFAADYGSTERAINQLVRLDTETPRSSHAPFNERLSYLALTGQKQWKLHDCLEKAYLFFAAESQLRDEVERVLYLLREASASGVAHSITLLTVCSLFESLVRAIYKHRVAPSRSTETQAFDAVKELVCAELKKRAEAGDRLSYERLAAILRNAEPVNIRGEFQAVVEHLRLKPDYWEDIFAVWTASRNPASHRITENDESEEASHTALKAESKIAGAINVMVLTLIGYSGPAIGSAYEEIDVQISPHVAAQSSRAWNAER